MDSTAPKTDNQRASSSSPSPPGGPSSSSSPSASASSSSSPSASPSGLSGWTFPVLLSYAQLYLHVLTIICFVLYFLSSLFLSFSLSDRLFTFILGFSTLAYILNLIRRYGIPQWSKQYWLNVVKDQQAMYILYAFILLQAPRNSVYLLPFITRSAVFASDALKRILSDKLPALHSKLQPYLQPILNAAPQIPQINAMMELVAFFYTFVLLLTPQRSILFLFLMYQFMRMRYMMDVQSQAAWRNIRLTCDRYILQSSMCPAVLKRVYTGIVNFISTQGTPPEEAAGGGAGGLASRCTIM